MPDCLVARWRLTRADTGRDVAECRPGLVGAQCESRTIFRKAMALTLTDPANGAVVMAVTAAFESRFEGMTKDSIFALCSAAFRGYPEPVKHEEIGVAL